MKNSTIVDDRIGLEASGGRTARGRAAHPHFFSGFLTTPRVAATGLLAVADVAAARYHQPLLKASLDPVVTANGDRLRFESFSACGGVYARLDVLEDGLDGGEPGHGTTNVDVNNPLRLALSRSPGPIRCTCASARTNSPSPPWTARSSRRRSRCPTVGSAVSPRRS
jgi:hypothetical protein